jgi:glutaredoxin 3
MKIYVKTGCPWCVDALAWLDRGGFDYEQINVLADRAAFDHMKSISGQSLTPTLETADGKVLPDFDTRQLEKFLQTHSIAP